MHKMLSFVLMAGVFLSACHKKDNKAQIEEVPSKPLVTALKPPIGPAVTATIGAQGGQLATADGKLKIIVPAGAVSTNQTFSIQPVEATVNNSIKATNSYKLLPEGATFSKPVTVVMQYDPTDITTGAEHLLRVATQDATGVWKTIPAALNKTNHTLTVETTHFSCFEFYDLFKLFSNKDTVLVGEKVKFKLGHQLSENDNVMSPLVPYVTTEFDRGGENHYFSITSHYVDVVKGWRVYEGPGSVVGKSSVNGLNSEAEYTAPDQVNGPKNVTIEVTLEGDKDIPDPWAPGGFSKLGKLIIHKTITVIPKDIALVTINGVEHWLKAGVSATSANGQTYVAASNDNGKISFIVNVGATVPGGYSCGEMQANNGNAWVNLSYTSGTDNAVLLTSGYCESQNNQTNPLYSSGTLNITRLGAIGQPLEGTWSGALYQQIPNTNGCQFYGADVGIKFYMIRKQ
ncbi:hypothetical protein [Paraflavitalea sp. CAU 1676]|uniref:hypothetical protein n=1 Tax=Paraflavitalea sp. CAU 1676 TaxID=3032598 RepID=UPI0023DB9F14|nr:hypothetical protein [Paraflavitalea sp. CAU 1676]MDF2192375.1 hypothetical protein [Paraflavitalea sp. CAU 1676]